MSEPNVSPSPRDRFFEQFKRLWEAADSPKPAAIVAAARLDKANGPKRISDWRNARYVPHNQEEFNRVVTALINRVKPDRRFSEDPLF